MVKIEELGGCGVIYLFFCTTSKFTWVPGQTQVPFLPLRELITVCKVRPASSTKSETLNHPSCHSLLTEYWGGKRQIVLALVLVSQ